MMNKLYHFQKSNLKNIINKRNSLSFLTHFYSTGQVIHSNISHDHQNVPPEDCEIVIVGGGVVGLALANSFASCSTIKESGYKIKVLESSDLTKIKNWSFEPNQWSNRISSINNQNIQFLKDIGAWKYVDQTRTNPVEQMQVWDGITNARIVFDSLDINSNPTSSQIEEENLKIPQMARFIENIHLQKALLKNLKNHSNVHIYNSTKVSSIISDEFNFPIVNMQDGKKIRARLLVGADGFNSPVKSYSKITSTGWNYDANCLVGTLELEKTSYNFTAWQRFLTTGPLGLLPLSDRHASLAWSTKPNIASGLKALDSTTLASIINASFQLSHESVNYILNRIAEHSPTSPIDNNEIQEEINWRKSYEISNLNQISRNDQLPPKVLRARMETVASFPLKMFHADQYLGTIENSNIKHGSELFPSRPTRTVLVGDAAHVLHPMAGQGLNLGLGDAKELSETIRRAIENGQDIGGLTALAPYARSRYLTNHLMMSTVDKLNKLYSIELKPIVWARSVGVEVLNEITILKSLMMGNAGGNHNNNNQISTSNFWLNLANFYDGFNKSKALFNVVTSLASSTISSALHRATTTPKN